MKLNYEDIINKHKGKPCFVALHGPSLSEEIKRDVQILQLVEKMLRISVNNWFDFFSIKPDYWVVSNGEFTIENSIKKSPLWDYHKYEKDCFNKYNIPLLYNSAADLTTQEFINKNLKCDYLPYDAKHFKQHDCRTILSNFKKHCIENQNLDFKFYGNNSQIWQRPNVAGLSAEMKTLHGRVGAGFDTRARCCEAKREITLQEQLQKLSGHSQHMGTGQTVGLMALVFAVLMGCDPIYYVGMDLDCSKGYSKNSNDTSHRWLNRGHLGHWKHIFRDFLLDDMRILKESAELMGIKIINLDSNSWYNTFDFGNLPKDTSTRVKVHNSNNVKLQGISYYLDCYKFWDINKCEKEFNSDSYYKMIDSVLSGTSTFYNSYIAAIDLQSYEKQYKKYSSDLPKNIIRDIKTSKKNKFYFKKFDFNLHIPDFLEINKSQEQKKDKVNDWYLKNQDFYHGASTSNKHEWEDELHYGQWYGIFKYYKNYKQGGVTTNEKLFAYCKLLVDGEMASIGLIWSHAEHLKSGIMLHLITSIVEECMKNKNIKYLTYYRWGEGLHIDSWKKRMLFKPTKFKIIP